MQPALTFDKPWKTGYLLDHVHCAKDLTWIPQDYQLVIKTQGGLFKKDVLLILESSTCMKNKIREGIGFLEVGIQSTQGRQSVIDLIFSKTNA